MNTQWILVADVRRAKIFSSTDQAIPELVEEIHNPTGAFKTLSSDRRWDLVEHQTESFSQAVARELDRALHLHRFESLVMVAEPHLLSKLLSALSTRVGKRICGSIKKDIAEWDDVTLIELMQISPDFLKLRKTETASEVLTTRGTMISA